MAFDLQLMAFDLQLMAFDLQFMALVMAALDVGLEGAMQFVPIAFGAILQGYLYGLLIRVPDRGPIGLCKGLIVTLIQLLVGLLLA